MALHRRYSSLFIVLLLACAGPAPIERDGGGGASNPPELTTAVSTRDVPSWAFGGPRFVEPRPGELVHAGDRFSAVARETLRIEAPDAALELEPSSVARGSWRAPRAEVSLGDDGSAVRGHEVLRPLPFGLEQRWRFEAEPGTSGELIVQVPVRGTWEVTRDELGLMLTRGAARFRYGDGRWVDADARETRVAAQWTGSAIELRVPSDVLAESRYPAVLDPILGPVFEVDPALHPGSPLGFQRSCDASWDGTQHVVVWREIGAPVRFNRVAADGTVLDGPGVPLDVGDGVAVGSSPSLSLIAWQTTSGLRAVRVSPAGAVLDATPLAGSVSGTVTDIAYGDGVFFIVYQVRPATGRQHIVGVRVREDGTVLDEPPLVLSDVSNTAVEPRVAFGGGRFLVTWYQWLASTMPQYVARRVSSSGVLEDASPLVVAPVVEPSQLHDVGSDGSVFLTVYPVGADLWARRVAADGSLLDSAPLFVDRASESQVRVGWNGSRWIVACALRDYGASETRVVVHAIDATATPAIVGSAPLAGANAEYPVVEPMIAVSSAPQPLLAYVSEDSDVRGSRHESMTGFLDVPPFLIGQGANGQVSPLAAWNGSSFLVVWLDRQLAAPGWYGTRLASDGTPLDPAPFLVRAGASPEIGQLLAHGSEYVAAWVETSPPTGYTLRAQRIGAGALIGGPFTVPTDEPPYVTLWRLASDGTNLLVTWRRGDVFARRFDVAGAAIDAVPLNMPFSPFAVTNVALDAVGRPGQFVVGLRGDRAVRIACVSSAGALLDSSWRVVRSTTDRLGMALATDGAQTLVGWSESSGSYVTRVAPDGSLLDSAPIPVHPYPPVRLTLAFEGGHYVAGLVEPSSGLNAMWLTQSGGLHPGAPFVISPTASVGSHDVASDGAGHTLFVWSERVDGAIRNLRLRARIATRAASLGTPCVDGAECESGYCVDGVCCDGTCGGGAPDDCLACATAMGGLSDGTCETVGSAWTCRASGGACDPSESCDGVSAACPANAFEPDGTSCDDGALCDGIDRCVTGSCAPGAPPDCDDANTCTADACAEPAGCVHAPIAGCCRADAECDDGAACTLDRCEGASCAHEAIAGCCSTDEQCEDGDMCTADSCADAAECAHVEIAGCCRGDADCDDGVTCTSDRCVDAACVHDAIAGCCGSDADCGGPDPCVAGRCDVSTGACSFESVPECCRVDAECDDGDVCTADACDDASNRCEAAAIDACCRMDSDCALVACSTATCDAATHACSYAPVAECCAIDAECDDGDECTADRCADGGCMHSMDPACAPAPGGCGCRALRSRPSTPGIAALLLIVAIVMSRRRDAVR